MQSGTPKPGERWLQAHHNRIVVIDRVSELNCEVWWHYEGESSPHCCDIADFTMWDGYRRLS